ncbi:molybdenum cofactor cytidylyltransferase [Vallitalea guaymasensis]|uniref:Molybdenum cofactor cytidylyltransferase n=1 Tax=Vallitalea guaymasensis TaxID=1185412 RepID=A0A8J8MF15_9FIRM|nr:molybdenum cofactor cytidylyltransferase [Vallitalea guaymasensis]QUH31683.1 molybdenum cofactor cytidylyltransferase [Vallitalea guaymasensis]
MVTAIILAAGFSRRFGKEKLLMKLDGKPMITHVIETIIKSDFKEIILVYQNEEIKKIAENYNVKHVYNQSSITGMSSSLKCAIMEASETDAYMFINGDQPFVDSQVIEELITTFNNRKESIIVPRYDGERGNPVIFGSNWKDDFLRITGDIGGRNIIKDNKEEVYYLDISESKWGLDIDTKEDYLIIKELTDNE